MFTDFRQREREREKHQSVASNRCPDQGSNPQSRYVPWPGKKLQPFSVWVDAPTNWATWPGQVCLLFKNHYASAILPHPQYLAGGLHRYPGKGFSDGTADFFSPPRRRKQPFVIFGVHLPFLLLFIPSLFLNSSSLFVPFCSVGCGRDMYSFKQK